jgi:glycosyltransferase involved in cell wall biosynthesis
MPASNTSTPQLLVVMPVFNEQEAVGTVARSWFHALSSELPDFILLAINDGSSDHTPAVLETLRADLGPRFEIITHPNRGHGQSCITGYHAAIERGIPFILQIDSDGQSDPRHFPDFWHRRHQYDVIYGMRNRQDGRRRILASFLLRLLLRLHAGVRCVDANVPYRLMNTSACAAAIRSIPAHISLANIALAVTLRKQPSIRHGHVHIGFPPRIGGEPSVPFRKFAFKAIELFKQMKQAGL